MRRDASNAPSIDGRVADSLRPDRGERIALGDGSIRRTEVERVLDGWSLLVFAILSIACAAAIAIFVNELFRAADWRFHPGAGVLLTLVLVAIIADHQGRWYLLLLMRRPAHVPPAPGIRVAVVTTFVPGAESLEMIEKTLTAMTELDYPHDTWLLDEGVTHAARELCDRLGVNYFTRHGDERYQQTSGQFKRGSKHGNYNAWLTEIGYADYDVLAAFDPDHVPVRQYLERMLGHFAHPDVGYVQAPQAFRNHGDSFIARGAAEEGFAFYSVVQMAAFGAGYPVIIGSHNVHRLAALEEVGGFADHDADDLLLTLKYQSARWEGVYVPEILARGLAPADWRSYLTQQRRWARSVLDIKIRRWKRYSKNLPRGARLMSFLHGVNYLHRAILIATGLLLLLFLLIANQTPTVLRQPPIMGIAVLFGVLNVAELFRHRYFLERDSLRRPLWRTGVLEFGKWPWFLLALFDVLAHRRHGYVVTRKVGRAASAIAFVRFHLAVAALIAAAWTTGLLINGDVEPLLGALASIGIIGSVALAVTGVRPRDASSTDSRTRTSSGTSSP